MARSKTTSGSNAALWPMKPSHALLWQGVVLGIALLILIWFGPIGLIACLLDLALALVGLWCLIVLMQKDVKEGFKERAEEIDTQL